GLGNHFRAIEDFDRALEIEPDASDTHYNKGMAHLALGSFRRALNSFDRAIAINDKDSDYFAFRALAHAGLGDSESAESDFKMAVSLGFDAVVLREQVDNLMERIQGSR
ncbi:MAG: tetratricopeptide repeat protein, partial [Chloroflexi bacterium]|nr:tetratricopeptide repeat protein [Chloroflexota bacterium]